MEILPKKAFLLIELSWFISTCKFWVIVVYSGMNQKNMPVINITKLIIKRINRKRVLKKKGRIQNPYPHFRRTSHS